MQLTELQKHTGQMCEAYGLDSRIERYKGARPISFYRWDLDCILDVLDLNLTDEVLYPDKQSEGYKALSALSTALKQMYKDAYQHDRLSI
jgi:hypothetical protein